MWILTLLLVTITQAEHKYGPTEGTYTLEN